MEIPRRQFALALLLALSGCNDPGVGRACSAPAATEPGQSGLVDPALECPSRLCLQQAPDEPGAAVRSTCTIACATDDDCAGAVTGPATAGQCATSFVCAVPFVAGRMRCQRFCLCRDDLRAGFNLDAASSAPMTPAACSP